MMNQIWKEQIINCPIHGKSITRIPVYQPNSSINTNYYIQRKPNNYSYSTYETEPAHAKSNSNYYYKSITSRRPHQSIKNQSTNYSKYSTINNSYNNNSVSLSNAYKSSTNNPIRIYNNGSSNYSMRNNANTQRNKPINIKNVSNPIRIQTQVIEKKSYNISSNSQKNRINSSNNKINNNQTKGGTSSYRRRNENNGNNSMNMNIIQKKMTPDRIYNRTRNDNYSNDIKRLSIKSFGYNNSNLGNSGVYTVSSINRDSIRTNNNRIREYSSKTNDIINRRIINTEPPLYSERSNNSTIVNSTDLNNYKFYISGGNYLNYNSNIYDAQIAQPTLPNKNVYIQTNPYPKIINTEFYGGNNYNDNSYYEINKYMNKNPHSIYEVHYGFHNSGSIIKYDRSSPLLKLYDNNHENISTVPSIPRRPYINNVQKNKEISDERINKSKKKKKIMKYKIHHLKELRENEFKIQNVKKEKIKEKKEIKDKKEKTNDGKVEEHVERYFDKDGNCIGGKKVIIKQEYDNGQKIIKKLVEEKYKSNSGYETLKKQGEINYNNSHKKSEKKGSKISSSKKGSNIEALEENQDEENNINTIVTFGMNSKNSKIEDDIILENANEDKEADEQNIDINTEFDDEEKNDTINKEPDLDKKNFNEENEDEQDKNNCEEENSVNDNLEEKSRENGGMNNDMDKNFVIESDEKNNENQNEDFTNEENNSIKNDL